MSDIEAHVINESGGRPLALRTGAELAGSFVACFGIYTAYTFGTAIYGPNLPFIVIATGLAYAVATILFSKVSGGQFNPAVTVAAVLTSKTKPLDGLAYIVAQVVGGIAAAALIHVLLPVSQQVTSMVWLRYAVNGYDKASILYISLADYGVNFGIAVAIIIEVIAGLVVVGAAMHTLGEHGQATHKHAWTMGLAYGLAAAVAYPITGAGFNPARSTGIALFGQNAGLSEQPLQQLWVFWIAPILAAAVVALVIIVTQLVLNQKAHDAADASAVGISVTDTDNGDIADSDEDAFEETQGAEDEDTTTPDEKDSATSDEGDERGKTTSSHDSEAADAADGESADLDEQANAEIGDQQSDAQGDADKGIERD